MVVQELQGLLLGRGLILQQPLDHAIVEGLAAPRCVARAVDLSGLVLPAPLIQLVSFEAPITGIVWAPSDKQEENRGQGKLMRALRRSKRFSTTSLEKPPQAREYFGSICRKSSVIG